MDRTGLLRVVVLLTLILAGLAAALWGAAQSATGWDWGGLALNLGTEMIGAVAIYLLLERILGVREKLAARKRELISEMGSRVHDVAVAAAEELRRHGWLTDGSLWRANLLGANLEGADLREANLEGANLREANLVWANLEGANLRGARGANLRGANLREANLRGTDLGGGELWVSDLRIIWSHKGALERKTQGGGQWVLKLIGPYLDGNTVLPDGTKWSADTDVARFTNPDHSKFWRSDNPRSPAYKPEEEE